MYKLMRSGMLIVSVCFITGTSYAGGADIIKAVAQPKKIQFNINKILDSLELIKINYMQDVIKDYWDKRKFKILVKNNERYKIHKGAFDGNL